MSAIPFYKVVRQNLINLADAKYRRTGASLYKCAFIKEPKSDLSNRLKVGVWKSTQLISEKIIMRPLNQTSNGINREQGKPKGEMPDSNSALPNKTPAKMKAGVAKNSDGLALPPDAEHIQLSHSTPVTTGQRKHRKEVIPANLVKDMLSDKNGPFNRQQLLAFSRSPITQKDVRPIPRTWPVQLLSAKDVCTWGDKLVKSHQKIFDKEGKQSYLKAVINAVFPDDENKPAHLPDKLEAFCLALDEQVIHQCRDRGLSEEEFDTLRMRVLGGFINGRVLYKHLRPEIMDDEDTSQKEFQIDRDLLTAAADKLMPYLNKILAVNDTLLQPIPLALPQVQQKLTPTMQIKKLLGKRFIQDIENTEYANEFYQRAAIYLNSSIKNKRFMMTSLLCLYQQIPEDDDTHYLARLDRAAEFIYDKRHKLDKLTREGQLYMLNQIELISSPDRRKTLSTVLLAQALEFAAGILPPVQEGDSVSESDSVNL